nr:phosphatase PAP2 family protein [Polymorphobacter sp.]
MDLAADLGHHDPMAWAEAMAAARAGLLRLSDREIALVGRTAAAARRAHLEQTAVVVSWLGNGTIYLILSIALLAFAGDAAWRELAVAALCGAISHVVYPAIKRVAGRPRPFEHRAGLVAPSAPLDVFSFPSGHLMTLTATMTPVLFAWPSLWLVALALWLALAWSRVATAHHYPSDLLGGTLLGVGIALPVTWALR